MRLGGFAEDEDGDPSGASTRADDARVVGVGVATDVVDGTDADGTVGAGNATIMLDGAVENKNKNQ